MCTDTQWFWQQLLESCTPPPYVYDLCVMMVIICRVCSTFFSFFFNACHHWSSEIGQPSGFDCVLVLCFLTLSYVINLHTSIMQPLYGCRILKKNKIQRSNSLQSKTLAFQRWITFWTFNSVQNFWLFNELIELINSLIILNVEFQKILMVNICLHAKIQVSIHKITKVIKKLC